MIVKNPYEKCIYKENHFININHNSTEKYYFDESYEINEIIKTEKSIILMKYIFGKNTIKIEDFLNEIYISDIIVIYHGLIKLLILDEFNIEYYNDNVQYKIQIFENKVIILKRKNKYSSFEEISDNSVLSEILDIIDVKFHLVP